MPPDDDMERFAEFFKGSDKIKKYAAEFDDLDNSIHRRLDPSSPQNKNNSIEREEELAEILGRKTKTGFRGLGKGLKNTKIEAQMII